jgi:hypothetical protein
VRPHVVNARTGCVGVGSNLVSKKNAADTQPTTFRNKPRVSLHEIALAMNELGATAGGINHPNLVRWRQKFIQTTSCSTEVARVNGSNA